MTHLYSREASALLCAFLTCCSPETKRVQSPKEVNRGDIMDISTWDFGEGNPEVVVQPQKTVQQKNQYAIVVATFTGDQHEQSASSTRQQLSAQYPSIGRQLKIRPRSRGSALTYGDYLGYDDVRAKKDIAMLREVPTARGTPLFAQVMLMRFKASRLTQNLHPHDLWTVRREFPKIVPIYTLEVGVWGDFDSGEFPKERRRAAAEQYASELRRKGFKAYFYHNDEAEMSSVTVGLFGPSAVDAETGFYSYEVEAMISKFPSRLINGQEVMAYYNPAKPELGSNVQPPCLAEVPVD